MLLDVNIRCRVTIGWSVIVVCRWLLLLAGISPFVQRARLLWSCMFRYHCLAAVWFVLSFAAKELAHADAKESATRNTQDSKHH